MLREQVGKLIEQAGIEIELFEVEKKYMKNNALVTDEQLKAIENNSTSRFSEAYIERSNKETDELITTEAPGFLEESMLYLKKHKAEFLYIESKWFGMIGVDAISLEVDDVFGTYEAMLGLKLKKNQEQAIKMFLDKELLGEGKKFNLMFNQQDGLWDLNITLDMMNSFEENMSIGQALRLIYRFIFSLLEEIEK